MELAVIRRVAGALLDVACPPRCVGCGAGSPGETGFCAPCLEDLRPFESPCCGRCATPLVTALPVESPPAGDCPVCRSERWRFDATIALGPYEGALRRLILDAKRGHAAPIAVALGRLLATRRVDLLRECGAVAVTSAPPHWSRRLGRGGDNVQAMARAIAAELGLPYRSLLTRVRATPSQTSVAPSRRVANVRGVFAARRGRVPTGGTLLLVDDVLTTGATASAAAAVLKRAGAGRVVAVVAGKRLGPA